MNKFLLKRFKDNSGFTLAELLVSATISMVVIISGYTLSKIALEANKRDESSLNLATEVDNGLTFILDEVKSGTSLLDNPNQVEAKCRNYTGEFLFGINLPNQAVSKDKYSSNTTSWESINCPIIYSLTPTRTPRLKANFFSLMRRGPEIDQKGFYQSNTSNSFLAHTIDMKMVDKLDCAPSWNKRVVRGITVCMSSDKKAVELGISSKNTITALRDVKLRKTSAAFTRILDKNIMGEVYSIGKASSSPGNPCMAGCNCMLFGTQIIKDRVLFSIDKSGSMGWVRIQGKTAMEAAKNQLIEMVKCLKDGTTFNLVAFNSWQSYAFPRSIKMDSNYRRRAIDWISRLRAGGGTRPFQGLTRAVQDPNVGQIVVMSDGWTNPNGYCFHTRRYQSYAECYQKYNKQVREIDTKRFPDKVRIDSMSIGNNYCSGRGWNGDWLGTLAAKNEGTCVLIR